METSSTNLHMVSKYFIEGVFQVVLLEAMFFNWSVKKHNEPNFLFGNWETFSRENSCFYSSCKVNYLLVFMPLFYLSKEWKEEPTFQQTGGLLMKNTSVICL